MAETLVLFAHPALEKSRVHRRLVEAARSIPGIDVHDLYEAYPDYEVDVSAEQAHLLAHEVVVLQFPLYWYSVPPLLKQWFDLVLTHGWAYGTGGTALRGKVLLSAVTTGGRESAYAPDGLNRHTVLEFLVPLEQTARMCGMEWWAPFLVQGTHLLDEAGIAQSAARYRVALERLRDGKIDSAAARTARYLNDLLDADGGP